jgi:hypothetical protein
MTTATKFYSSKNIAVGDTIRTEYDDDDEYGKVIEVKPKCIIVDYCDKAQVPGHVCESKYEVDYDVIEEHIPNATPNIVKSVQDVDPDTDAMGRKPSTQRTLPAGVHALAAADQKVTVKPGTIVTIASSGAGPLRGMHKDRLYVVLAWTKNSARGSVNVAPVNGVQPGEKFSYDYMRVQVSSCTPVLFGVYVKVPANQKGSK